MNNATPQERHMARVGREQRRIIHAAALALGGGDLPAKGQDRDALWAAAAEATLPRRRALVEGAQADAEEAVMRAMEKRARKAAKRLGTRRAE